MRPLYFKPDLYKLVIAGKKTSTLRKHTTLKPNDVVIGKCGTKEQELCVQAVTPIMLDELDLTIALKEGFISVEQLRERLESLYPGIRQFVMIDFLLCEA